MQDVGTGTGTSPKCSSPTKKLSAAKDFADASRANKFDDIALQAYAGQRADWLVGINLTRIVSAGNTEPFPVERVQTAVLFQVALRNHQARDFAPLPYWELEAEMTDGSGKETKSLPINTETGKALIPRQRRLPFPAQGSRAQRKTQH